MEQRLIQDKEELRLLILSTIFSKKETFSLAEIVENVIDNKAFNRNLCSTVELIEKVTETLDISVELGVVKVESRSTENNSEKFIVSNIT